MEPMTLGSPSGSPLPTSSNFVPSFLMGEPTTAPTTPRNNTLSPSKGRSLAFTAQSIPTQQQRATTAGSPLMHHQKPFGYHSTPPMNSGSQSGQPNVSISAGPPTQSLFDSLQNERNYVDHQVNTSMHLGGGVGHTQPLRSLTTASNLNLNQSMQQYNQSFNDSYINNSDFNVSRMAPFSKEFEYSNRAAATSPPYFNDCMSPPLHHTPLSRQQPHSNFWITVYGFPQSATSTILSHFSQCGTIVEKIFPPQNGNWIHIKFASRLECDRALNYHERIIGNSLMIGVSYCKDPMIVDKENLERSSSSVPINRVRPLTHAAYKNAQGSSEVIASPTAPKRSTGIVNKAMDMIFGW